MFLFCERGIFLIIYVDVLMLSGPESEHAEFWARLSKHVELEPYEELDRYFGRHHTSEECERLDYNLLEHFKSPVDTAQRLQIVEPATSSHEYHGLVANVSQSSKVVSTLPFFLQ